MGSDCCKQLHTNTEAASCDVVASAAITAEQYTPKLLPAGFPECAISHTRDTDTEAAESKSCKPRAVMSKSEASVVACLEVGGSCSLEVCAGQRVVACTCGLLICLGQQPQQSLLLLPCKVMLEDILHIKRIGATQHAASLSCSVMLPGNGKQQLSSDMLSNTEFMTADVFRKQQQQQATA